MILESIAPESSKYSTVDRSPNPESIRKYIESLPWTDITIIKLKKDEARWVECSGSHEDGFCIIYRDKEESFISKEAIYELEQAILVLQDFSIGGSDWKEAVVWANYGKKTGCLSIIIISFVLLAFSSTYRFIT